MMISVPFLIITFLVYGFIPELRNLHGKSLMCYVVGLTLLFTSLSVVPLGRVVLESNTMLCSISGYMIYTSVLLCFFWLNVMCYDIWSAFKRVQGSSMIGDKSKFLLYSLYAFGVPFMCTLFVIIMDNLSIVPEYLRPGIGEDRCFLKSKLRLLFK